MKIKTSNKVLLASLLLLIGSLTVYNYQLKAAYQKGSYKYPYTNYLPLNFRDFNSIELNASTAANVMLVKGPFKVLAAPEAMEFLKIEQRGSSLIIDATFKYNFQGARSDYVLYISCPELSSVKADARYVADENTIVDTLASEDFRWRPTVIRGFSGDSLSIVADHASNIVLEDNQFNRLTANVGVSNGSATDLTIGPGNQFTANDLNILNKSRLWIKGKNDHPINYRLADSAKLILNGYTQNDYLKKINPIKP